MKHFWCMCNTISWKWHYTYRQLRIGWHRILRLILETFNLVPGAPWFITYYLVLIVNPMGRILVRWNSSGNNLEIQCHPICNRPHIMHHICMCNTFIGNHIAHTHEIVFLYCMCVYVCVLVCVRVCVCACVHMCLCVCVCVCVCVSLSLSLSFSLCMCVCVYECVCVCACYIGWHYGWGDVCVCMCV